MACTERRWTHLAVEAAAGTPALAAGLLASAAAAQILPGHDVADYQVLVVLAGLLTAVFSWGTGEAAHRFVAASAADHPQAARAVYVRLVQAAGLAALPAALVVGLVAWLGVPGGRQGAYGLAAALIVPLACATAQGGALRGLGEERSLLVVGGVCGLLQLAGAVAAVLWAPALLWFLVAAAGAAWVRLVLLKQLTAARFRARGADPRRPVAWDPPDVRRLLAFGRGVSLLLLADLLFGPRVEVLFLNAWSLKHDTAQYALAGDLAAAVALLPLLFAGVLVPSTPPLDEDADDEAWAEPWLTRFRLSAFVILPAGAAALVWARPLCAALFGERYADAAEPLRWVLPPAMLYALAGAALVARRRGGREPFPVWGAVAGGGLKVILAVMLIPGHGAHGAALAAAAGACLAAGTAIAYVLGTARLAPDWVALGRAAGATVAALGLAWAASRYAPAWVAGLTGLAAYGGALVASGALPATERKHLAALFGGTPVSMEEAQEEENEKEAAPPAEQAAAEETEEAEPETAGEADAEEPPPVPAEKPEADGDAAPNGAGNAPEGGDNAPDDEEPPPT